MSVQRGWLKWQAKNQSYPFDHLPWWEQVPETRQGSRRVAGPARCGSDLTAEGTPKDLAIWSQKRTGERATSKKKNWIPFSMHKEASVEMPEDILYLWLNLLVTPFINPSMDNGSTSPSSDNYPLYHLSFWCLLHKTTP